MQERSIQKSLKILSLLTIVLIALGSYVRATGAGLSCPDWPLCFGRAVPKFEYGVAQEVIHRYIAAGVMLFSIFILYRGYRLRAKENGTFIFGLSIVSIVIVQAIFGGLTVTMKLNPFIVTTHLALGTLFFQTVATAAIANKKQTAKLVISDIGSKEGRKFRFWVGGVAALTYLQILIGGFVGASGAALACPDFPNCGIEYLSGAQIIQMTHRILAGVVTLSVLGLFIWSRKLQGASRFVSSKLLGINVGIISLQLIVGWLNLYFLITPAITVTHIVLAQAILLHLLLVWSRLGALVESPVVSQERAANESFNSQVRSASL
jgi:cytochrome c oxidase assembly protein subunit 15